MKYAMSTINLSASALRTLIFTAGHFFIDFFTIMMITGSTVEAAAQASIVAPILNGVWYFLLDRTWTVLHLVTEDRDLHKDK